MRVVDVVRIDYVGLLLLTPWSIMGDIIMKRETTLFWTHSSKGGARRSELDLVQIIFYK